MKSINRYLKPSLFVFLMLIAFFVTNISAQRRRPVLSKKAQIVNLKAQGLKQFQSRDYDAAIESFSKCIALKPILNDADDCFLGRGTAYFLLNKYEEAIPDFGEAYRSFMDFNAVYLRGRAYFELKKYAEANKDFFLVIMMVEPEKIKKDFPEIYGYRGATYVALDELDKGIADYTTALELNPKSVDFLYARGLAYDMKDDFPHAEKDLREALRLDPNMKDKVDEVFERIRIKQNGAVQIDKTIRNPAENVKDLTKIADDYFKADNYPKAIETYSKILELEPSNAGIYYKRGTSYGNQSQYRLAIADYSKTIELDPKYAEAYSSRGASYRELGEFEAAIKDLSKAIEIQPDDHFNYIFRATAYCKTGQKELSKADEEKAKKLGGTVFSPCQ